MPDIGQPERATQKRVIALFRDELRYRYSLFPSWAGSRNSSKSCANKNAKPRENTSTGKATIAGVNAIY